MFVAYIEVFHAALYHAFSRIAIARKHTFGQRAMIDSDADGSP